MKLKSLCFLIYPAPVELFLMGLCSHPNKKNIKIKSKYMYNKDNSNFTGRPMESKNLSTEDSKSENIAKKQKQAFSSQTSALSKGPQNQKNTPRPLMTVICPLTKSPWALHDQKNPLPVTRNGI